MPSNRNRVSTGVGELDRLLGSLFIGDNVVWYDDAGSLAMIFCLNFIQASRTQSKPLIYVSFDRSPKNLLDTLGSLADYPMLTVLDCFTHGKGESADIFLKFYRKSKGKKFGRIIPVEHPESVEKTMEAFYGLQSEYDDDVRFVFESLTGMQKLWAGEDDILNFYSHSCPRLYELNTVAYWVIEKRAHSPRLRAQINQVAQVAVELSIKRGKTALKILKAEKRDTETLNTPFHYWTKKLEVTFDSARKHNGRIDLANRLKELRTKRGFSQTELAKLVGVTPSSISQIESNLIYPSLPALLKMAEVLSVEVSSFFQDCLETSGRVVFPSSEALDCQLEGIPKKSVLAKRLTPVDFEPKAEPYLIEIPPKETLATHFFVHKGDELGYVLSGKLVLKMKSAAHALKAGDLIYLTSSMPSQWKNPGPGTAKVLWVKIR